MSIRVVRLGTPRSPGEGLRLGTVRRPPRGVPKSQFAKRDFYDLWLPELSPSPAAVKMALAATTPRQWSAFVRRYRREMAAPERARMIQLLASFSRAADFSVGCYCEDENRCHRSVLRELLTEQGAKMSR